jgi:serine/threonine protein kinase
MEVGRITSVSFFGNEKFAVGKILKGGMGTVYQLVPIRADAPPIALKTLQNVLSAQDFERECNAWLSVAQHENIARAWSFGKWEGSPAILIDWYPRSMSELSVSECDDDYLLNIVNGLLSALDFAYNSAGLVHQDIKPANILINEYGAARLSDFGLARCVNNLVDHPISPN